MLAAAACSDNSLPDPRIDGVVCPQTLIREVNDHWLATHEDPGDNLWHRATYMTANMALAQTLDDPVYRAYGGSWARRHGYAINDGPETWNADNHCAGQTYLLLYELDGKPEMLRGIKAAIDFRIAHRKVDDWYWIDAQYMAMPVFAQLANITGEERYREEMFARFVDARDRRGLWDEAEGLWYRDESFAWPEHKTPNGKKIFWSRGNGWVVGALVRTLDQLPSDHPYRAEYEGKLRAMATALARVQRPDGLWNVSLADGADYPGPEASGTAFFTYGIAWGINRGVLDRETFLPVVDRAWRGLARIALRADNELGYVQGVADQPSSSQPVTIKSTRDYGTGAFLLAGSEVMQLGIDFGCP